MGNEVAFWKGFWNLENWEKSICLGEEGKENRKRKRKRINKEKIFSLGLKMKLLNRQIPGLKSKMWKSIRKMPESSEIQVFRNDSKIAKYSKRLKRLCTNVSISSILCFDLSQNTQRD